jgi:hypothetical protein
MSKKKKFEILSTKFETKMSKPKLKTLNSKQTEMSLPTGPGTDRGRGRQAKD